MFTHTPEFESLHTSLRHIAKQIAAPAAPEVDREGRFPGETLQALKAAKLLSAAAPKSFGGAGLKLRELGLLCAGLASACGSSGMVLAMHYNQLACLARHYAEADFFASYLRELAEEQYLLASMTSEVGTSGDTRISICALERGDGRFTLNKQATTGSYCAHADAILVTCRRHRDAPSNDQLLVLVLRDDYRLTQTSSWDALGMRGTCSPGFDLASSGAEAQILADDFADIAALTMVPYSHILWAAVWWGIARDAVNKAGHFVRAQARKTPGTLPPSAVRLAEVSADLQGMKHHWLALAAEFDDIAAGADAASRFQDIRWALKMNSLKVAASQQAPQIVHQALQIVGLLGYKNDSPYSLGRQYRDVLSASLMISNDRIAGKSAGLLMVAKDEF